MNMHNWKISSRSFSAILPTSPIYWSRLEKFGEVWRSLEKFGEVWTLWRYWRNVVRSLERAEGLDEWEKPC
jgi:hypothetical protein